MKTPGLVAGGIAATMSLTAVPHAPAQERSLDEIKAEFMRRAGKINPFEDIRREDAEKVVAALKSLDKDHWADEWCKIGLTYEAKADALAKTDGSRERLPELYMHAFDACRVGRYPSPVSPGKVAAYQHSLRMFSKAAKLYDPPLEVVEIPFEGKKLVGYLQKPPGVDEAAGGACTGAAWTAGKRTGCNSPPKS